MSANITTLLIFQNLQLPEYEQIITDCAGDIMERYSEVQSSIVYENVGKLVDNILRDEMTNTTRIINIQKYLHYKRNELEPYYMLTVIIKNLQELQKYFDSVYRILGWNSRAKHFIIYIGVEDVLEIFKMSWKKYIVKLVVMNKNQDIYTYYPLENNNCGRFIEKRFLFNCREINFGILDEIFNAQPWNSFAGCKVKVLTFPVIPYVINVDDETSPGFEIKALNELGKQMNFSIEYVRHSYTYWGVKEADNTYTQMYNGFYHKEADMMLGMLVANGTYLYDFDSSIAHTKSDLAFFVPPAQAAHPWENIMQVYSNVIWLTIGVTAVVMTFFWYTVARIRSKPVKFTRLSTCIIYVLGMMFGKSMPHPRIPIFRYIFIIWTFYSLVLTSTFESSLMSFLTKPAYKIEIDTFEELLNSDLKCGGYAYSKELFDPTGSIYKNWINCDLNEACVNRTATFKDFAAISDVRQVDYLTPKYYLNTDGTSKVLQLPVTSSFYMWILMLKGFPLRAGLDKMIQRFIETGFMEKWIQEVTYETRVSASSTHVALNIQHVLFPIAVLVGGFALSFVVFIFEVVSARIA